MEDDDDEACHISLLATNKRIFNFGIFVRTLHVFMFSVEIKCR